MSHLTDGRRSQLEYKFCRLLIKYYLTASDDYVIPFLKPVDEVADEAPSYYEIIEHPMDLSTMLQIVDSRTIPFYFTGVRGLFRHMFSNCYEYNEPGCEVYQMGKAFERAFDEVWAKKDDWIRAEAIGRPREDILPKPRSDVLPKDIQNENDRSKEPESQNRARNEDGLEKRLDTDDIPNTLNHNGKRPLDTASTAETPAPSSPQRQALVTEQATTTQTNTSPESDPSSVEQESAKRPRLEPSAEPPFESPSAHLSPTPRLAEQHQQQPTSDQSPIDPSEADLADKVTKQITSHITRITIITNGEFDRHRYFWNLFCRNEKRLECEQAWKAKAMEKIDALPHRNVRKSLGLQEQVDKAFKETVREQVKEFAHQINERVADFQ